MTDNGSFIVFGVFIGAFLMFILLAALGDTYKNGQIDALSDTVKYELVKQDNDSVQWQRIGDK